MQPRLRMHYIATHPTMSDNPSPATPRLSTCGRRRPTHLVAGPPWPHTAFAPPADVLTRSGTVSARSDPVVDPSQLTQTHKPARDQRTSPPHNATRSDNDTKSPTNHVSATESYYPRPRCVASDSPIYLQLARTPLLTGDTTVARNSTS